MKLIIERPELTDYQKDILYCPQRFTVTEASTKAGKTFSHIWWLFERAHADWNKPGYNHWWVAPIADQASIAFERMRVAVSRSGLYKINLTKKIITTPIGTHIHFKSAHEEDSLYGEDVYSAVFDEAPRAKFAAWVALRSTLTATEAPCKLIGNFGGASNWMHQMKKRAVSDSANYAYFKITAWDAVRAGILSQTEIEQAQKDLPLKIFKQLYLAEEQESEDMLCTYDSIRDLFTNTHVSKDDDEMWITSDIALHGSDKFRVWVWKGWRCVKRYCIPKSDGPEVETFLKDTAEKYKVKRSNIIYDADGLGSFLRGYLKGAKPFNNGGTPFPEKGVKTNYKNLKAQCGYWLAKYINNGMIYIEDATEEEMTEIIKELECLQSYALDADGKMQLFPKKKIIELIGHSPDILDVMIMKMFSILAPKMGGPRSKVI